MEIRPGIIDGKQNADHWYSFIVFPTLLFRLLAGFVVGLETVHDVGGQVVERSLDVALAEILAIDKDVVCPFAYTARAASCVEAARFTFFSRVLPVCC